MPTAKRASPISYSPSVTITLTSDCPWRCKYCGFRTQSTGLIREERIGQLLDTAVEQGAREILLISGEEPDSLPHIKEQLSEQRFESFIHFADAVASQVLSRGLLPHSNFGALNEDELLILRKTNPSCGVMLENVDAGLNQRVAPQKAVESRIATLEAAGRIRLPFTSGILIGLGESRESRIDSLRLLAEIHSRYGHLQEIIIQNFVPNEGSAWLSEQKVELNDYLELITFWREVAPDVPVQVPPNLNPHWVDLLPYVDDLGGISELGDVVNPLSRWAKRREYADAAAAAGRTLAERLPVYPRFIEEDAAGRLTGRGWLSDNVRRVVQSCQVQARRKDKPAFEKSMTRTARMRVPLRDAIWTWPLERLREEANALNHQLNGDVVTYVVNRNVNFTNVCNVGCAFCGFQRKASALDAYTRSPGEVVERLSSTPEITEVCMQGGINPALEIDYYFDLLKAVKTWKPEIHIHAFSPMEIHSLHRKTGWSYDVVLGLLQESGLDSIPGTAAEILDDRVRGEISSRKLSAEQWCSIVRTAHQHGIPSTATIMFGHVENWGHIRAHFDLLRQIEEETGGFTEFVPLRFIADENPLGHSIRPDGRDVDRKMERIYPLARLYFGDLIPHLQTSWVKLGTEVAAESLAWGCDDFGGTLFEESITRSSGGCHGEVRSAEEIEAAIRAAGKSPRQRTTLYEFVANQK